MHCLKKLLHRNPTIRLSTHLALDYRDNAARRDNVRQQWLSLVTYVLFVKTEELLKHGTRSSHRTVHLQDRVKRRFTQC